MKEHRAKEAREREAMRQQMEAAAEMGIELEPVPVAPSAPMPTLPKVFHEQHPFNAGVSK